MPLDRHFVIYPEGADVDEGDVFYTGSLVYTGTLFCRDAGIEEGSNRCRTSTLATGVDEVRQPVAAGRGRF